MAPARNKFAAVFAYRAEGNHACFSREQGKFGVDEDLHLNFRPLHEHADCERAVRPIS